MLTVKRLYLYGVMGIALTLLLWGLTDLVRFVLGELAQAVGSNPAFGGRFEREELSRAVALVLVAGSIFGVHLALVRRSLQGSPAEIADERASASRATYFFLVLIGTGIAFGTSLFELVDQLITSVAFGQRSWGLAGSVSSVIVVGSAWALHVLARRTDLRSAPERTAGDWLTRAYLYGALFATVLLASFAASQVLTTVARQLLDLRPLWETTRWWQEAIVGPLAGTLVCTAGWLTHWFFANRLLHAPDPMGEAHRSSRTRRGYFLTVVLASAATVLVLAMTSLQSVFAEMMGAWRPTDGSRLIEDIGGPLLMAAPFALVWWWHLRRVSRESFALGGPVEARASTRTGRFIVAIVGLAGFATGLAWTLQSLLDAIGTSSRASLFSSATLADAVAPALAVGLVGLVMWTPAWALSQRDRARHAVEAATSTSRRAYLLLVSGVAVVAAMGSLAFLVWQATRLLLESGELHDSSWALAILAVAAVVLLYHLWELRSDLVVARTSGAGEPEMPPTPPIDTASRELETILISAPAGSDFRVLNAAIRSELPDGYELRVVPDAKPTTTES